jgi:hypothetical protein
VVLPLLFCPFVLQVKRRFEQKQKHFEKKRDHLLTSIEIAEEDAFLCEVPGWNNQTYIDAVEEMRRCEPYASPRTVGGGAARSPNAARSARSPTTPTVGQISAGMARARITEMEDSD